MMSFGRNKAKVYAEKDIETRFEDVAGADEAKAELVEVVDYLKEPQRYQQLEKDAQGSFAGRPARYGQDAAGACRCRRSECPFFTISGFEFVEMFVGVGAARVRELFQQAREKPRVLSLLMNWTPSAKPGGR